MKWIWTAILLIPLTVTGQSLTASDIVKKAEDLVRGKSNRSEISMTIVKPDWQRTFEMKAWALGTEYSMIMVTEPVRDKGTVTLKRKNEVWNYLPTINKNIKIPSSMMMQSWMGSDFTNDDLVKESSLSKDYTHTMLGDTTIDGMACWIIEYKPKPESAVVWDKIIGYITKDQYFEVLSEFYDEYGDKVRIMTASNIRNAGNRVIPTKFELIPLDKPGNKTIFEYQSIYFDVELEPSFFSIQNMKRVR